MPDDLELLKAACARVAGAGSRGTGYVVAPGCIVTCQHVVKKWQESDRHTIYLGPDQLEFEAWLLKSDKANDAAVLAFEDSYGFEPLPLADTFERKDTFLGYGYPNLAKEAGVPIEGVVRDPKAKDQDGRPAIQISSGEIAAGQASPLHGFSGSPILVDGAVVGHLTRHLGDPDDLTRASYGIAYACPVAAVKNLLNSIGIRAAARAITSTVPAIESLADAIVPLQEDQYHVFVSYRSKDRDKADAIVARMEGAGLKVFYDQTALKSGDYLTGQLEAGLTKSRAAVVLVSHEWLKSRWCEQEMSYLVKRAVDEEAFRLIPVRLDDCRMPALLDSRVWIDFSGVSLEEPSWTLDKSRLERSAGAREIEKLMWAVVGQKPPAPQSTAARLGASDSDATQEFVSRIRIATRASADRVLRILNEYREAELADETPTLVAAESLIALGEPKQALAVLDALRETGLRGQQLRGLALAKCDRVGEAIELLEALYDKGHLDPETAGILAGRYKQSFRDTGDLAALERSHQIYKGAWERTEDPYNGINAAATALWLGNKDEARDEAVLVRTILKKRPDNQFTHWDWASIGEAYLLSGRINEAGNYYREAVSAASGKHQDIAVMRRQARLHLEALQRERNELDNVLPVPNVVAFFGHMTDAADRLQERFPTRKVGAVRREIRSELQKLGPIFSFSGAARGSDIIFLEEVLRKKGQAQVILPFPEARFLETSGGGDWNRRFREIQANPRTKFEVLRKEPPPDEQLPEVFVESNREVQKRTAEYAKLLDEKAVVIAVWDGKPGDGPGGTADAVQLWEADGYDVDVIDITDI